MATPNVSDASAAAWHHRVRASSRLIFTTLPTQEQIARRAQEIYIKSGRRDGQSEHNWFQAERELITQAVMVQEDAQPDPPEPDEAELSISAANAARYAPAFRSPRLRLTGSMS